MEETAGSVIALMAIWTSFSFLGAYPLSYLMGTSFPVAFSLLIGFPFSVLSGLITGFCLSGPDGRFLGRYCLVLSLALFTMILSYAGCFFFFSWLLGLYL